MAEDSRLETSARRLTATTVRRGQQIFRAVAVERVGRAIVAAVERAPEGFRACKVVDPYFWTFAGLASESEG